ncbi:hypothetical protein GCM10023216_00850 [Isoptericola chiayiensis]|uniref:DUF11 domain-containing protein n=1 Tax=Isoptericola chiayiensis TaxID=579446 RepID=A0ABP8XZE0_9MICO
MAVATVGVVSVLGSLDAGDSTLPEDPPPVAIASPWPTEDEEQQVDATPAEPTPEPSEDPTDPANVPPLVDPDIDEIVLPDPAAVAVTVADDVLAPRTTERLSFAVTNTGGSVAEQTTVTLALPAGMGLVEGSAAVGAANLPQPLDVSSLPCTATSQPQQVQCSVGTLEPGASRTLSVPVSVRDGGTYSVSAQVWADGLEPRRIELDPMQVAYFGAELRARSEDTVKAGNPGQASVPFTVANTGDRTAGAGWQVEVSVPAGLEPRSVSGDLDCARADERRTWTCQGGDLAPGAQVSGALSVVADGTTEAGAYDVGVRPVLGGDGATVRTATSVDVPRGWQGAFSGVGGIEASCAVVGGFDDADAVVAGTYTNRTERTVVVALTAAGADPVGSRSLAPGESTRLVVHDGLRVPSGEATWTLSTTVAGSTYSRTVTGGAHGAAECYDPAWGVRTSAQVVNDGSRVRVDGTVTNVSDEPMQAGMSGAGGQADRVRLDVGQTATLSILTDKASVASGDVRFDLYRWVSDRDGDQPANGIVPVTAPTASYPAATIAPAAGAAERVGECTYDAGTETSTQKYSVLLDNSASTLPSRYEVVVGDQVRELRLAGGESTTVRFDVPWGTRSGTVSADGRELATLDVRFESCATPLTWPQAATVTADARCDAGTAEVVVDVRNEGGRSWEATLLHGGSVAGSRALGGDASARFVVGAGSMKAPDGSATVRLVRSIEGTPQTVEQTVSYEGVRCVVRDPVSALDTGEIRVDENGDWVTSWREVAVELDNSGSNVPVDFRVVGPNGLDAAFTVPAGETRATDPARVDGRRGGTWTVTAGDRSRELTVETFTGAEAGWCAERIAWGTTYGEGDVRSWNGTAYRYLGWDESAPGYASWHRLRSQKWSDDDDAPWYTSGRWRGVWMGQWQQWEKVGTCEYR